MPVNTIVVGTAAPIQAMIFSRSMLAITFWLTAFVVTRYRETAAARVEAERALRRTEAALREQTALAQLGQMAAVVAHEVRNPLAGIRGAMQVIGRRLPADRPGAGDRPRSGRRHRRAERHRPGSAALCAAAAAGGCSACRSSGLLTEHGGAPAR